MFKQTILFSLSLLSSVYAESSPPDSSTTIPNSLMIQVIDVSNGAQLGTLNGYGNFSSPGPSFLFRSQNSASEPFGDVSMRMINGHNYVPCVISTMQTLACGGDIEGANAEFYQSQDGSLALLQSGSAFSVDAINDVAGGKNQNGVKWGIPVHVRNASAVPVVLRIMKARG